jgi:Beta-lactamase
VSDVPDDWLASLHFSAARLAQPPKSINSPLHHLGEAAISCEMLTTRQASEDDGTFLEEVFLQAMRVQHSGFCGRGPKVVWPVADTTRRVESCISLCSRAVVVLMTCASVTATTGAQTGASPKDRLAAVDDHLTRYVVLKNSDHRYMQLASQMESLHVPAVSMAAIWHGRIDWAQAYGVTSLRGERATRRTMFGAASMSKPVRSTSILT